MKMRGLLVLLGLMFGWVLAQDQPEYQNRALERALAKDGIAGFTNLSEVGIPDSIQTTSMGKFFEISPAGDQYKYVYAGRVNSCRAGGCSTQAKSAGNSEYFDYFILFDADKSVQVVKVFNYQATHGYEITSRGWLKQFAGHDGSESLQVNKNIDAISGATISVQAITEDVQRQTALLQRMEI
ncbi:FMN-binding protein [Marinilabilia salmonicolor]|jgi:Na+-translocating ferredoxin:NAD+ oxidoreductase RnfG subunit|uniref:FMN-binding protein n=2 Tax=Marinilabilia salmonicolor TaxID=989 RepID=A0A2T0XBS6_9BACT|nr:FMN-binding protein [Marinilabilia salmonicolor]RCW37542.1 FMN-binding protein [Marinilabilia salmonicolor]